MVQPIFKIDHTSHRERNSFLTKELRNWFTLYNMSLVVIGKSVSETHPIFYDRTYSA